jgi:uncharacterized protein YecE (DUF72 family)
LRIAAIAMKATRGKIHIGTSGWSYPHWQGAFYPEKLAERERLGFYARHFDSVEINNSFYRLPSPDTLARWRDSVPPGFRFALKASRYVTHMKKLQDPDKSLAGLFERAAVLEDKLGPILFQMPPRWHCNAQRLASFLAALPTGFRYAFEFRDRSWINDRTYALLASHGVAFCIYELDGFLSPRQVTTDFCYIRLHGPAGPYQGSYATQTLAGWAGACASWSRQGHDVFCFFDNDQKANAAIDAERLRRMLETA